MRFLQALRALLQTWQGVALSILAIIGAIYYGPRKMLETWDWYWDRFRDNEVFLVISHRKIIQSPGGYTVIHGFAPPTVELPYSVGEIATQLGRKRSSILRSLKRLRRRLKAEPYEGGWRMKT